MKDDLGSAGCCSLSSFLKYIIQIKEKKKVISLIFGASLIWRTDFGSYE
jgi:hypothetical protein